jgi:large repetitive protein
MRLKEKLLTGLLLMPLVGTSAWAKERANYDAFLASREARSLPVSESDIQARGARVEHVEERLGVPTFLWSARTGLEGAGAMAGQPAEQAARAHLQQFADVYRLRREDVSSASLQSVHKTDRGPVVARFTQKVEGIEVFRSGLNVVMDRNNDLVAITGYMAPNEAVSARRRTASMDFLLGANEAIARAFRDLTDTAISGRSLVAVGTQGDYVQFTFERGVGAVLPHAMSSPARAKKVYFTLADSLQPAWYVELNVGSKSSDDSDYYSFIVSATDGTLLFRNNLTVEDAFTFRVWADPTSFIPFDGPHGNDATPHPTGTPDRYQAPFVAPNLITVQNVPFSRNDPWLPANATQTTGNNVDAYADLGAPDGFQPETDLRANTTAPGVFDYTYDVTKAPGFSTDQRKAAVAHLFYVNNFLHDWFYDAGFDEISGNAQASNYGRGGLEGDSLRVEAQDYGGRNNANMSTPSDGARPRMQMYIFDGVPNMRTLAPPSLAGGFEVGTGAFGSSNYDLTGELKILDPEGDTYACEPFPAGTFAGKIAVVDRGPLPPGTACGFTVKALHAQQAGAIAVIIANHTAGQGAPGMGGTDPAITVPVVSSSKETADAWKAEVRTNNSTIEVRMQRNPNLDRDGTIDNAIVAHEWGHYISNRLIGNSNGLTNNQGRAMGEGWADFTAMLMMVREEDRTRPGNAQFQGVYAVAGYTQSGGVNNGHYFGIRRVPYSTDMAKNALTYRHFANGNPLPAHHPILGNTTGVGNAQVHNGGEVWATMLWECYASLLNAYPFQEAQDRMKQYLVAAFKATPNAPTLLEARDALLAAAAASDPADYTRFAQAFARRGAGFGAKAADRDAADHVGMVESFVSGNNLEVVSIRLDDSAEGCDRDGVLDVGETGLLTVTVRNTGAGALPAFTGTVSASGASTTMEFPNGNTLSFPALQRSATATRTLRVRLAAVTGAAPSAGLTLTFDEPSLPMAARTATYDGRVHYDEVMNSSTVDAFEGELSAWTSTLINRSPGWKPATERNPDGTIRRFLHVPDLAVVSDVILTSPWVKVNPTGNFIMTFRYRHSLEGTVGGSGMAAPFYDGVVLEFSTDGVTWKDAFLDLGRNPGYAAFLANTDNPLSERAAFVGTNAAFPGWSTSTVNLGTAFAGRDVRVRFRIGTDGAVGAYGFALDDVQFTNIANLPFGSLVPETSDGTTCNRRPIADAGLPRVVPEFDATMTRQTVTLNGSASFDPDGDPLTYAWTQVAGPAITLANPNTATPSFLADVPANTTYVFQLVVSDGMDSSQPKQVEITVLNVNRKPVAVATAPGSVDERSTPTITLDGSSSSDEDGEPLTYTWRQIDNGAPEVVLSNPSSATPSFNTPEVSANTQFAFSLVVNDGYENSAPVTVAVTVNNVDRAPTASAGENMTVDGRTLVTLSGSGGDPDGDTISYAWTQVQGSAVSLVGADTATPSFTSPDVKAAEVLRFQLTVTANGQSASDTVTITVRADRPPTVNAGVAQIVNGRTPVNLFGSASDPEGDAITYAWTVLEAPPGVTINLQNADTATPSFISPDVKLEAVLRFQLTVTANGLSASDTVAVTVRADRAPTVSAGGAQTVNGRTPVTLAGFATDPEDDEITYAWTQVDGPTVDLTGADTATPSFTSPDVKAEAVLRFQLTVTANGLSVSDTVSITVRADRAPTVNAGGAQIVNGRAPVTLFGSASDAEGDTISYSWTVLEAPPGVTIDLQNADTATPSFTSPDVKAEAVLRFQLTVTANGLSASDTVTVTVRADRAPTASAGPDRDVNARESVTLHGAGNDLDGDAITYAWTQVDGPSVDLTNADTATLSFTAPDVRATTTLVFQLVVSANGLSSDPATVTVTVNKANRRPVGKGPTSFEEAEGTTVTLDASESSDPDGDELTYSWTQTGGPPVTLTGQNTAQLQFTTPEVTTDTLVSFVLIVTDPDGSASEPIPVFIKVLNVNKPPVPQPRKLSGERAEDTVTLDGATSRDPDGEALTYKWEQTEGPQVTLSSTTEATVTFKAPNVQAATKLVFKLTVTDPNGASASQTVEVMVQPKPAVPTDPDEGGCASTGSSSGSLLLLSLLAGVLLSRRRLVSRS